MGCFPRIFDDMFETNGAMRARSTRQDNDIHVKYSRTNIGQKSIKVTGAKLWNKLPILFHKSKSLNSFKRRVKEVLGMN